MKSVVLFNVILLLLGSSMGLKDPICGLPPRVEGFHNAVCYAYFPVYSYNANTNECVHWIYGGCGANENIFDTKSKCESKCKE